MKGISAVIATILMLLITIALAGTAYLYITNTFTPSNIAKSCTDSGGTIGSNLCCLSSGDFPNSCLIGACGCSPLNSHSVKTCECPTGQCFDGTKCISTSATATVK